MKHDIKQENVIGLGAFAANKRSGYSCAQSFLKENSNTNRTECPVFLFCPSALSANSQRLQMAFPGEVSYAVKANPETMVLKTLWGSGIRSFDVASLNEVRLIRSLFPTAKLHFNNPVRSEETIRLVYEALGVRSFVVDDALGMQALAPYLSDEMEITVRFKLAHKDAAYDFGSKFGATPQASAKLLKTVRDSGARTALTFHPGSQCTSPAVYEEYIAAAAKIASLGGGSLGRLNVGGGFPVAYEKTEVSSVNAYFDTINNAVQRYFPVDPPALLCEPGRAMVANSVSLMTKVVHIRETGEVFLNDGVYGGLQEQSIMDMQLPVKVWREGKPLPLSGNPRTLFGPTCDPVDRLSTLYRLREDLAVGDQVEFGLMGAYGSATQTRFNGFEVAEYVRLEHGF